jgi:uncharacterized protein (DUF302 family)
MRDNFAAQQGEQTMKTRWYVVVLLLVPWHVLAEVGGLLEKDSGIVTKPSPYSVSETMDRVETAAKGIGATIFNRFDYQEMSKKVGVEIPPNQLLIFGRGKGGPFLMKEAPLAGIDLPFKALAWQDAQGKVWLSYTTGSYIDKRYAVKGAAESIKNINETIDKIVSEALK